MSRFTLILTLLILSFSSYSQDTINIESEKDSIKACIQTAYVEGLQNEGDVKKIDSGIHPGFNLLGIDKGNEMWNLSIDDWKKKVIERRENGILPKSDKGIVTVEFKSIDITGTAAVAKIEFFVDNVLTYVDYISLYKFEDGWKMVNKIYYKF